MVDILGIADAADMIVNGYAFTKSDDVIRVLNLNKPSRASVINDEGKVLETNMDDIEIGIILEYFEKNKRYIEED